MAIIPLDTTFDGFYTDLSRDQLPPGSCHRLRDYIPQNDAPARKRGGWLYASGFLGGSWISGGGWFRKSGDLDSEYVLAVNDEGKVSKLADLNADDGEIIGAMKKVDKPLSHSSLSFDNKLIFIKPDGGLVKWDGKKLSDGVSGWKVAAPWGDFLIVGNKKGTSNRIAWCETADSIITDPVTGIDSTWDLPAEVVGIAGFPRQILVFGYQDTYSLWGDTPPPGGNLEMHPLFVGCGLMDQRSMVTTSGYVVWANSSGIYRTDGSGPIPEDLTLKGGISTFWRDLVKNFKLEDGWIACAGVRHNYYFITIHDDEATLITTLVCDLNTSKWFEESNIGASCYIHRPGGINSTEELFFGKRDEQRIASLGGLWAPDGTNQYDADGYKIKPVMETRFYRLTRGDDLKRVRHLYAHYDLHSTAGFTELDISWIDSPSETEYTSATGIFEPTSEAKTDRVDIRARVRGIAFKIEQTDPSDDTRIYELKLEGHALSEMR